MDVAETSIAALVPTEPLGDLRALPQDLVFVDLETTGGNAAYHRITEVGIVRLRHGKLEEEWSSLVNPGCKIPAYIESFTGISNEMVADAPRFADIAPQVLDRLIAAEAGRSAPIFVAHNARFDYSFLRTEFRRLDIQFSARVMCTVKLSRRLFPQFPRHSLDAVMERHGLVCSARHRALGDARVLRDFWSKLRGEVAEDRLAAAAHAVLGANRLPAYLPAGLADELPEGPGVYRFFDAEGALLYIGRSASLRTRVLGHFAAEQPDVKEQKKAARVRRIDWIETAGVLGAQLKEAQWIKSQRPLFNRRPKPANESVTLRALQPHGVHIESICELKPVALADCFGVFHSRKDARKALTDIARAQSLCLKTLGLEDGGGASAAGGALQSEPNAGACLAYHLGRCRGACIGKESVLVHGMRLHMALSSLKLKSWPFPGRIALQEGGEWHVLDHWTFLGTARSEEELAALADDHGSETFDVDVYRILLRHFAKNPATPWRDLAKKSVGSIESA